MTRPSLIITFNILFSSICLLGAANITANKLSDEADDGWSASEAEIAQEHRTGFNAERWRTAMRQRAKLPIHDADKWNPDNSVLKQALKKQTGIFVGTSDGKQVNVRRTGNKNSRFSFGAVGAGFEVSTTALTLDGLLILPYDPDQIGDVDPSSLRIFRWDELQGRHVKMPRNGMNPETGHVWARIAHPGEYSIIGIRSYPAVRETIELFCDLHPGNRAEQRQAVNEICTQILCANTDGVTAMTPDPTTVERGICDQCLSLERIDLPECEIPDIDELQYCSDTWQPVGPTNMSGPILQIEQDPIDQKRIYAMSATGGLWVLDNIDDYPLETWKPLTDNLDSLAMIAFAIAPSDTEVMYAVNVLDLYRTSNGGRSWTVRHLPPGVDCRDVMKLLVHPENPNRLYMAIGKDPRNQTANAGLYASSDGGANWTLESSGEAHDVLFDPDDPAIMYHARKGAGVYKKSSSSTWNLILDDPTMDAPITLAVGERNVDGTLQSDANRRVAVKANNRVYVRDNDQQHWQVTDGVGAGTWNAWASVLGIDPCNADNVLAGGIQLDGSLDGGVTWPADQKNLAGETHADTQDILFERNCDPSDRRVYLALDGGVFSSLDGGRTWPVFDSGAHDPDHVAEFITKRNLNKGLITAQIFRAGIQDNVALTTLNHWGVAGSANLVSGSWNWDIARRIKPWEWVSVFSDPTRAGRFYIFGQPLLIANYPQIWTGGQFYLGIQLPTRLFAPNHYQPFSRARSQTALVPISADPRPQSQTILVGVNKNYGIPGHKDYFLIRTKDGDNLPWTAATDIASSRDHSSWNDVPKWDEQLHTGQDAVAAVVFSAAEPGRAYVMTFSGEVYSKREVNDDSPWEQRGRWDLTTDCADQSNVRQMVLNKDDELFAIASATTRTHAHCNKFARSLNRGRTWEVMDTQGQVSETIFRSVAVDPADTSTLYLGTEVGVFISADKGASWERYGHGLPNVEVSQLVLEGDHLYAATYGRGLWQSRICSE